MDESVKHRVLVVDDDKIIVESLTEFLDLEGYEAVGVSSFAEAVKALQRRPF